MKPYYITYRHVRVWMATCLLFLEFCILFMRTCMPPHIRIIVFWLRKCLRCYIVHEDFTTRHYHKFTTWYGLTLSVIYDNSQNKVILCKTFSERYCKNENIFDDKTNNLKGFVWDKAWWFHTASNHGHICYNNEKIIVVIVSLVSRLQ